MIENLEHPTKKTKVYIPCWKTITDLITGDNGFSFSVKVLFEYLSMQSSKGTSIQYREIPVTACRTFPIEDKLCNILWEQFDKKNDERIINVLQLIFSTLTHMEYKSSLKLQESVIELALILNDEFNIEIMIISNDKNINDIKNSLKSKYPDTYKDDCFKILDSNKWLEEEIKQKNPEVIEAYLKVFSLNKK